MELTKDSPLGPTVNTECIMAGMNWCNIQAEKLFADFCKVTECHSQFPSMAEACKNSGGDLADPGVPDPGLEPETCRPPKVKQPNGDCVDPPPIARNTGEREVNECEAKQRTSSDACTPGQGIVLGSSGSSIASMCRHFQSNSLASAGEYAEFGRRCQDGALACRSACATAKTAAGSNAAFQNRITNAVAQCTLNSQKAAQAGRQGIASMGNAQRAEECRKHAAANAPPPGSTPPTSGTPNPQSQKPNGDKANNQSPTGSGGGGSSPSPTSNSYSSNGSGYYPGSTQQPQEQVPTPAGAGGFREADAQVKAENFNVAPETQMNSANGYAGEPPKLPGGGAPGGAGRVPNNSGGSIPGGEGGGQGARLQPQRAGGGPAPNGNVADILQGFQGAGGGGGGSRGSGLSDDSDGGRFRGGSGNRANGQGRDPASAGIDLKNYLPGGSMHSGNRAGGFRPTSMMDINSMHTNIWVKVGDRLRERCRLGRLFDCR